MITTKKVTSQLSEAEKIDFAFIWLNWNQIFNLTLHKEIEEDLKSLKQTVSAALNNLWLPNDKWIEFEYKKNKILLCFTLDKRKSIIF